MPNQKTNYRQLYKDATDFLTHGGESDVLTSWIVNHHMTAGQPGAPCGNEPAISVIVPCHNYGIYLKECIHSIILQTFTAWELIIVNDGSTDTTHEVALGLLAEFPSHYISYVNQPQSGIVQPRNRGVGMARGEYILPLDADDMIAPQFLEKTHALLSSRPDLGFVSTKALFFGDINKIWPRAAFNPHQLFIKNQQGNTTLYRKEMWQDVGGYTESMIHGYMDWEFWIKCVKHGWTGEQIDEPLYFYRRKNDSIVMKAKKNDAHIKTQIMHLHPEVYDVSRIKPNDDRLSKKNFIHPDFLRKDFSVTPKKSSRAAREHLSPGKKKILFICHNFPPRRYAGAQLYALNLAQEINRRNLAHVEVLYPVFDEQDTSVYISSDNFDGVTVHQLHKPKTGLTHDNYRNETLRDALASFYAQGAYDAVHVHSLGGQLSGIPIEIALNMNIPVVLTLHDHWFLCYFWFLTTPDQQMCTGPESAQKCAQCILTHSTSCHAKKENSELITQFAQERDAYLSQIFHKTNLRMAPSRFLATTFARFGFDGIDIQPLGMLPQTPLAKSPSRPVRFGYIGRISHRKGVNILLEAYQRVVTDSGTPATLHIFGAFDDPELEKTTRQLVTSMPNISYEGQYQPKDLPQIFATIDILVVPSLWENYPLVVQEAFMHKTPVIASDVGGFPEAITHNRNGLLFRVGSVDDLAATMRRVINNPTLLAELTENILPVRSIADDAAFYAQHYGCLLAADPTPTPSPNSNAVPRGELPTVQFYVYKNVHWPMFESLFEYLRGRDDVREIVICLPNLPNLTSSGTNHHLVEKILTLGARIVTDPRKANADVTFIADTIAGKVHGCGRIVNVGHGTISKGYYFTESVWTERENWVDLLCVPGEYARERMSAILKTKVVATGMPKLDPVFSGRYTKNALCSALGLNPSKKIVLYAPTFNLNLSSVFAFADSFHRLDSPDRYVLIKLHGSTLPNLIEQYRRIAKNSRQIIFIEDNNIAPYIGGADIMISDVSSAFMEFMALNKPVILYDNPGWGTYHGFDPENIEYAWRDLGSRINSFEELPPLLDRLMVQSDGKELIRQKYAAQLFADRTGHACENVWQETLRLAQTPSTSPLPVFSVVIHVEQDAHILLRSLIHDLQFYSVMPMELILVATEGSLPEGFINPLVQFNEFVPCKLVDAPQIQTAEKAVALGVNASSGDFICVLREDVALFKNFDYMLYKTFAAHPEIASLTGLTNLPLPEINSNRYPGQ
jgi:glycosyltransferase involved in cell wall biosynthesis